MSNKRLNATITIGGSIAGSFGGALGSATSQLGKLGDQIRALEREQAKLNKSAHAFTGYSSGALGDVVAKHERITRELQKQRAIASAKAGMESGKERMGSAAAGLGVVGAIAGAAAFPIVQAAKFETAMLGVAKQVDGARDSSGKLTSVYFDMKKQIQQLGREMPMATSEIAGMVAAGARMGIVKDELIEFTRTAGMMAEAFELPAAELADQMGKIRTLFGMKTQAEVRALADSVNYLDDNAISKGGDILEFLERTGGVAGAVKITGTQMAALGSTLLTLGTRTQVAGTAVNAIFQKLAAAEKGTKKFRGAMGELGLGLKDVQKGMQTDAQGTLLKVLDKINAMPAEKRLGAMVDLVGLEHSDELAKLAAGVGEYRHQIELASSQKAEGSMSREFQARLGTTAAQFEIAKNRAGELGEKIGSVLLPAVNQMLPALGNAVTQTAEWTGKNSGLIGDLATLAGGLTAGFAAWKLFNLGVGGATFAFNALKLAMASHPVLLAATLLGTAALLIYKNWEPIKDFFAGLWISITEGATNAFEWVIGKVSWVSEQIHALATLGSQPPPIAPPRGGGGVGASTTNNTITINQQPGQSGPALARDLADEIEKRNAIRSRSMNFDVAEAYP